MGFIHMELGDKMESLSLSGRVILEATKKGTRELINGVLSLGEVVFRAENHNMICNEGLLLVAGFAVDESAVYDVGITYCEIGTNDTAPAAGDGALTTYHGRKIVTSKSRTDYDNTYVTFFTAAQSTCFIKEAGMYGGSNAAAGQDTGLLFSHFLVSFDNSAGLYDVTITYILTVGRV